MAELDLTDAQKATVKGALDQLAASARARGPRGDAPLAALAASVRAGNVDPSMAVEPPGARSGFEEHRAAVADALQTLHATLTKEQRRALVDVLAKRMEAQGPKGARGPGCDESAAPGGEGACGHGPPARARGARADMPLSVPPRMGMLGGLLSELELTDAQREAIEHALEAQRPAAPDPAVMRQRFEAMRAELRARLEVFAVERFDAKAALAPLEGDKANPPMPPHALVVKELAVVVPILDPAQREKLATLLEQAPRGGAHGPGRRGPWATPAP
jgi:Spy/CpxP family protein refolding chaperone